MRRQEVRDEKTSVKGCGGEQFRLWKQAERVLVVSGYGFGGKQIGLRIQAVRVEEASSWCWVKG